MSSTVVRLKRAVKSVLGTVPARRNVSVRKDDVFIVSYPKSGNTWTRFLIANIISEPGLEVDFKNIDFLVPDIYQASNNQLAKMDSPRYLKSHEYFDPRYKKVIYIVRDPRDVLVSYYYYLMKMSALLSNETLDQFARRFIDGEVDSFGDWGENVASWLSVSSLDSSRVLVLRYEDMLSDTKGSVKQINDFLHLPSCERDIDHIVSMSSFERMKNLEIKQSLNWKPVKNSRKDISFVRSGKKGEGRDVLSPEIIELIDKKWCSQMEKLRYS